MQYLAILKTDTNEYMCLSETEEGAKLGVFDGHNTFVKMLMELDHKNPLVEVTSEWLESRLRKYYNRILDGPVSIETLEEKWELTVLNISPDECYKNGAWTPRNEQDY